MIQFITFQTIMFDPTKYEKLKKSEGSFEVNTAMDELTDSCEFGEIIISKEDCHYIKRIEQQYSHSDDENVYYRSVIYVEKEDGTSIEIPNILGKPSIIINTINTQLESWYKEFEENNESMEVDWNQETFQSFIEEVMTYPKKERLKVLKSLEMEKAITLEFLEKLKEKNLLEEK